MATTFLTREFTDEINSNMAKRFMPKLKTGEETNYCHINNQSINTPIYANPFNKENDTLHRMTYLFPSVPQEVSK